MSNENAKSAKNAYSFDFTLSDAPFIPQYVFDDLPGSLSDICNIIKEPHLRDAFLISALPVIAAHLPNVLASDVENDYTPDFYTLITAAPATGKGILNKSRQLGKYLQDAILEINREEKARYNRLPKSKRDRISPPKNKALFIPGNSSSRAVYDMLDANGGRGLFFETEIDTMVNANSQEWGNFSDLTRKAFHHEATSLGRKEDYICIPRPCISMCLSGTFNQLRKMFPSAEDGHFSRFAFYTFSFPRKWRSHRPTNRSQTLDDLVDSFSQKLYTLYCQLQNRTKPLKIELSDHQWDMSDKLFGGHLQFIENAGLSVYLHSSNNRMPVIALRMISIFAVIRAFEKNPEKLLNTSVLTVNDTDVKSALGLTDTFFKHTIRLYYFLQGEKKFNPKGERYRCFLQTLPVEFTTKEALKIAERLNIPPRTVKNWFKDGSFEHLKHGHYRKRVI